MALKRLLRALKGPLMALMGLLRALRALIGNGKQGTEEAASRGT